MLPLLISPFRAQSMNLGEAVPAAILIFSDPGAETVVSEELLRLTFGLTPAQARLAAALISGQNLSDYAKAAGISINTAKTELRQVFDRTGHARQTDLVRAVAADPLTKLASFTNEGESKPPIQ